MTHVLREQEPLRALGRIGGVAQFDLPGLAEAVLQRCRRFAAEAERAAAPRGQEDCTASTGRRGRLFFRQAQSLG